VARARENAAANGLAARTTFEARDLYTLTAAELAATGDADRWLVDPPREGAFALVKALTELRREGARSASVPGDEAGGWQPPRRIAYVSCNPATLARDAGLLVHQAGYRCSTSIPTRSWGRSIDAGPGRKKGPRRAPWCLGCAQPQASGVTLSRDRRRRFPAAPAGC
jgi:hypothetical protein